ncbi:sensor histidine kinase [Lutispora thermophila]|uniref:GHKL domain-containing protein n=1 Tax=Lutispora thermophila DSM 19022 TaxID=1122184 RepID=A0A1M6DQ21_9FIRM|nr:sensor histidine kinase [Lutispora thermophila]SHI75327.1 GHKL domain-containing protein [Lutispora thermophila DSM 19022]
MLDNYDIIYLLSNIFGTYIIFKFMTFFFENDAVSKNFEFISYILYYLSIAIIYIMFNNPGVNLISNLILFFLLTFNYPASLKSRLIATIYIYAILLSVEALTVYGLKSMNLNQLSDDANVELIAALISTKIISYMIMLALSNFKMIKNDINISPMHWIAIILIPVGTLFSTFILITIEAQYKLYFILISISILFIINVFVFYLYDALIRSYNEKIEKELLHQQNNAYIKQLDIINQSNENIKILRHDIKNHISVLQVLIEKNDNKGALEYLHRIFDLIGESNNHIKSGNMPVDSILNYKINEAKKLGIEVDLELNMPEKLDIQPFDLSIILGNLFDNAIEAVSKLERDKTIKASIKLDRNVLYISISNPFDGNLVYENSDLKTTHRDKENHGFGLKSVKKAIGKYNGAITIQHTDSMFYADVLLYNFCHSF